MKKIAILALIVFALVGSAAAALGSGYPVAVVAADDEDTILVLGKFASGAGQFTQAEADGLVNTVAALVQGFLGSTGGAVVLNPTQMAGYGLGDADNVKALAKANYPAWGVDIFVFVDISKTAETAPGYGPNMRLSVYVVDMATLLGPPIPAGDLYIASIEVPYMYTTLLNSLL